MVEMEKRDSKIDFIKGMLIWGVVFGHALTMLFCDREAGPVPLLVFIRTYDMPFFMVLSGYFLRKSLARNHAIKVIANRITMIFVPIIVWTLIRRHVNIFGGLYYFLWAVLISGLICAGVSIMTATFKCNYRRAIEAVACCGIAFALHLFPAPWNMFYLFPFFAIGYCMQELPVRVGVSFNLIIVIVLLLSLCFWSANFTPWNMDGVSWRGDGCFAVVIFIYRFVLALLGIHVMWRVFEMIYGYWGEESWFARVIVSAGRETLPLYVLHMLPIGAVKRIILHVPVSAVNSNVVAYIIAPCLSLAIIVGLLPIIHMIKKSCWFRYSLGFKIWK